MNKLINCPKSNLIKNLCKPGSTTLLGGQAFNWDYINNSYYGFTQNGVIKIDEDTSISQINEDLDIYEYLGLNIDYENILGLINKDEIINKAITNTERITILKQPFVQTTLSYILATNKNIPAIRKSIRDLSKLLGNEVIMDNIKIYTFPSLENIANADIPLLQESKIGYRAKYLKESSQILLSNNIKDNLPNLSKEEIRKELISLPGIGPKVADCILLYSLGYLDTVPIDRWMYNIAKDIYSIPYTKYEDISKWYTDYFGQYAGIAGQYLFEYYRSL